ncbi:hypothetical protein B0H10DRAFT_2202658 [Mycena sp. CBHHK59/15]|nr:hypothetical protein B0H10DRAFT_2202658 [Mycena sp. CBHHK59/15]
MVVTLAPAVPQAHPHVILLLRTSCRALLRLCAPPSSRGETHPTLPDDGAVGDPGHKAVKRRIVQRRILEKLELFSPYPPEDLALPYNHQGHRLTAMRLRSGYTQNDRWFAGSYHQVCTGCPRCVTKKRVFVRVDPLPHHILEQPELKALFDARTELYPTTGGTTTASAPIAPHVTLPTIPTAPSPSPSPSPAPAPSPPASPSPVPAPLPADPAAKEAELPIPPHTPMRQTLHFHYGGYGGVMRIIPLRGKFWFLTPTPTTPLETSSTRPPSHRNRSRRVHTCAFDRLVPDTSCTNTICTMVYPRAKEDENPFTACIIANLVLQDFLDSLEARVFLMALRSSASSTPPVTGSLLAGMMRSLSLDATG